MIYRTDLADEAFDGQGSTAGVTSKNISVFGVKGSIIEVKTDEAAQKLNKIKGKYASFETDALLNRNVDEYENISRAIAFMLNKMLPIAPEDTVLVAGLGNRNMTADSIGPKTVEKIFVTRHIFEFMPGNADSRMRSVCAVAPGVLGVTGMESADIVAALCREARIKAVILIDALAAGKKERMFSTVQITDTGIEPGAGIGNKRRGLNSGTLGIPVLAIGVPTVVYASTLVYDSLKSFPEKEITDSVVEDDMIVTPKDVDIIASDSAKVIADGINLSLHTGMSLEEINGYMQ